MVGFELNKKYLWIIILFALVSGISIFYIQSHHGKAGSALDSGMIAPDFSLYSTDERNYQLSSLKGKTVVLNFWATWCPPCQEELQEIQAFYHEVKKDEEIIVLGINLTAEEESASAVRQFVKQHELSYPILLDMNDEIRKQYNILVIPTTFIINEKGKIVHKIVGPVTKEQLQRMTAQ